MRPALVTAMLTACALSSYALSAQAPGRPSFPGSSSRGLSPAADMPRPIAASDAVFIEQLTWLEVRDAILAGKTTAIIAIGGIEQSGPYLVVGKHEYVIRATTAAIARKLGDALVAPIVSFVPEGSTNPPSEFMRYPGTISVQIDTFKRLLTDIAESLKAQGFQHIVLISDHGGNISSVTDVVSTLSGKWAGTRTMIYYVPEYYDYPQLAEWLVSRGIRQVDEGYHDDVAISSIVMTEDPNAVRMQQRIAAGKFSINGVSLLPADRTIELGKAAIEYRADATAEAIRRAIRNQH